MESANNLSINLMQTLSKPDEMWLKRKEVGEMTSTKADGKGLKRTDRILWLPDDFLVFNIVWMDIIANTA